MNKFLLWLISSSADPNQFSLTIKGFLLQYVAVLLVVAKLVDVPLTETSVYEFIGSFTAIAGTLMACFGLLRKAFYEIKAMRNRYM